MCIMLKGGGSVPGAAAGSIKNREQNGSFYTINLRVSVSRGIQLFSISKGGPCRSVFNNPPSKKHRFYKSSTEFWNLVSGFESSR